MIWESIVLQQQGFCTLLEKRLVTIFLLLLLSVCRQQVSDLGDIRWVSRLVQMRPKITKQLLFICRLLLLLFICRLLLLDRLLENFFALHLCPLEGDFLLALESEPLDQTRLLLLRQLLLQVEEAWFQL